VTAIMSGYKSAEENGIFLTANRTRDVSLGLHLQEEVIEVSSNAIPRNTSNRTVVAAELVAAAELDELPSVNRASRTTSESPARSRALGRVTACVLPASL
jgi:hypothetical protein